MVAPYYDEGGITLYHARCEDVLPQLAAAAIDLVLTDPPYGIGLQADYAESYGVELKLSAERKRHAPVYGDDTPFDPSPLLSYGRVFLFGANYYRHTLPLDPSGGWLVWDKVCSNDVRRLPGWSDGELAWSNCFKGVRIFRHAWNGFSRSSENSFHVHPTQKPVALMRWILERWTVPGDTILDPYMGTGPVAQACKETGRRYIGIEVERQYVDVAVSRLQQEVLQLW